MGKSAKTWTPSESQSDKKFKHKLKSSIDAIKAEFASTKSATDYTMRMKSSMDRYAATRIDNLFAIVMPGGTGKTYCARKYGCVDVDECVAKPEHDALYHVRKKVMMEHGSWLEHNEKWASRVRITLEKLDYSRPVVLLCHTEEFAYEVGAIPLLTIVLEESAWRKNISKRSELGVMFSEINRASVLGHGLTQRIHVNDNKGVERALVRALTVNNIPVAAPNQHDSKWNPYYDRSVENWVIEGDTERCDIYKLLRWYELDMVPKECMDYFCNTDEMVASFGFGVTMCDWAKLFGELTYYMIDEKLTIPEGDPEDVWPYESEREKSRLNVNMKRMLTSTSIMDIGGARQLAASHAGSTNGFVTSLLAFWAGSGARLNEKIDVLSLCMIGQSSWVMCQKKVHDYVRTCRYYMNTELDMEERQTIMYMDQLVGRRMFKPDWEQVIDERKGNSGLCVHLAYDESKDQWTRDMYRRDFNDALNEAMSAIKSKPRTINIHDYGDFFRRRGEWLTKGSTVYTEIKPEHRKYVMEVMDEIGHVIREVAGRHNKKSLFEMSDVFELLGSGLELRNVTKAVPKLNECGYKDRTLLPGALFHYLVFAYVLHFAEKQAQIGSVRINSPSDNDIRYMDKKMTNGVYYMLFDWANFNAYHSAEEMGLVIERLKYVVPGPTDYAMFCDAIAESMWDMQLIDPEGKTHKLDNGLYSGWRGTSFINSVLNQCYVACAMKSFARMYHYDPIVFLDHGGDDLVNAMNNPKDTYRMLVVMEKMQYEAQKIKQMIGLEAEFFRVAYTLKGAHGSPTRALARFIAGNWESTGNIPLRERLTGLMDQMAKIVRRGYDRGAGDVLLALSISHWARTKSGDEWLSLPAVAIHGCEEQGGLGVPDAEDCVWVLDKPILASRAGEQPKPPGSRVAEDTIALLVRELGMMSVEVLGPQDIATKLAAKSFEDVSEEDYSLMLNTDARVVSRNPVIVEKWDLDEFDKLMEYSETDRSIRADMNKIERYKIMSGSLEYAGKPIGMSELAELMEINLPEDVFEVRFSKYYRRLVGEEWGSMIEEFVIGRMKYNNYSKARAEETFEVLCYMASRCFEHRV